MPSTEPRSDAPVPVSIRHYVDARFQDHDKQHTAEHRALDAASDAVDARLASMNEFRQSLSDAQNTYVSRAVIDAMDKAMGARIDNLAVQAQRGAIAAGIASGIIGVIGGLIIAGLLR